MTESENLVKIEKVESLGETKEEIVTNAEKTATDHYIEERKFQKRLMTIQEMIDLEIKLSEIFSYEGITMPISWVSLIKLVNYRLKSGKKLTKQSSIKEAFAAFSGVMGSGFLAD